MNTQLYKRLPLRSILKKGVDVNTGTVSLNLKKHMQILLNSNILEVSMLP